ncbi:MAG: ActS/PrrB/RegB family redox-sensitive histidine kinase [Pseudomonadota bacterium]
MSARGDWVRLRTLVLLRWIAVIGQSAAVLVAALTMGFELPLTLCAVLISAAVLANLLAVTLFPPETRLSENATMASLMFDLVQIVALLMATGGLNNPFALLVLAPVTISASTLRLQPTLWLGTAAIGLIALMSSLHLPLIGPEGNVMELPLVFRAGFAAALAVAIGFLSLYARRVTVESYAMSQALLATQIALAREQRLAAIGGIAAAAAHELGTPLATIKLVAKELVRDLEDRPDLAEDARLIHAEAERCGKIMTGLSSAKKSEGHIRSAPIAAVVEEAAAPHAERGITVVVMLNSVRLDDWPDEMEAMPIVERRPELIHGLRNLIQNAVDFAETTVWIDIAVDEFRLTLSIADDGPGFSAEILPRLGEPYISSRGRDARAKGPWPQGQPDDGYEGMGLGVFIARTLLERIGAELRFANIPKVALLPPVAHVIAKGSKTKHKQRRTKGAARPTTSTAKKPQASGQGVEGARGAITRVSWALSTIRQSKAEGRRLSGPNEEQGPATAISSA